MQRIDRWDVNSLEEVSIDKRPWKKGGAETWVVLTHTYADAHTHAHILTHRADVLFLKFNLDRRDRRRREYVLLEEGNNDMLLGLLNPIVEQNKATLSVENKLEVCVVQVCCILNIIIKSGHTHWYKYNSMLHLHAYV